MNEPQSAAPQFTVHLTCGFAETSLVITALRLNAALIWREAGVGAKKATAIGMGGVMVMVAETDFVVSTREVAVTATVAPEGMADGAV